MILFLKYWVLSEIDIFVTAFLKNTHPLSLWLFDIYPQHLSWDFSLGKWPCERLVVELSLAFCPKRDASQPFYFKIQHQLKFTILCYFRFTHLSQSTFVFGCSIRISIVRCSPVSVIDASGGHWMYGLIDRAGTAMHVKLALGNHSIWGLHTAIRRLVGLKPGSQCKIQRSPA